jgi:hypothetical protein
VFQGGNHLLAPPTWAKWAIPPPPKIEVPLIPITKSPNTKNGTKYFALIGMGKNNNIISAFGNIKAKATIMPYKAPEAPTAVVC